ncbi:MAG: hypothetical protein GY953_04755 [bacterium]|nr:hypothetical protein [bacterium]
MKRLIGFALPLVLALPLLAEKQDPSLRITVQVYNYARLDAGILDRAEREAARIFGSAGVDTEWLDCPLSPEEASRYPACNLAPAATRLTLRIVSREMADRMKLPKMSFGRSWLPEEGGFAYVSAVCAHRAEELANQIRGSEAAILGHLMAHELGHLLLGSGSHAPTGIMHVPWYPKELKLVKQGTMLFNSKQAKRIRTRVLMRMEAAAAQTRIADHPPL